MCNFLIDFLDNDLRLFKDNFFINFFIDFLDKDFLCNFFIDFFKDKNFLNDFIEFCIDSDFFIKSKFDFILYLILCEFNLTVLIRSLIISSTNFLSFTFNFLFKLM